MKNTQLIYRYNDMNGRKRSKVIVVAGVLTDEDRQAISISLRDGLKFIPGQVGLPALNGDTDDDHVWHTLDISSAVSTYMHPSISMTARELVDNFTSVTWKPEIEVNRINRPVESVFSLPRMPSLRDRAPGLR